MQTDVSSESAPPNVAPLVYSINEAARLLGISRASAYESARTGELPTCRFGRRIVVPVAQLEKLLAGVNNDVLH